MGTHRPGAGMAMALRVSKEIWFVPPELVVITPSFGGACVPFALRWCSEQSGRWVVAMIAILLAWAGSMLFPFLYKWNQVGPAIYPQGHNWMIEAGFLRTRLTLLGYFLVLFTGVNGFWASRARWTAALQVELHRKRFLALAAGLGLGAGALALSGAHVARGCVWGPPYPRWQYALSGDGLRCLTASSAGSIGVLSERSRGRSRYRFSPFWLFVLGE